MILVGLSAKVLIDYYYLKKGEVIMPRKIGRTTRMLEVAEAEALKGGAVYIIASTRSDSKRIERLFGAKKALALGIKFESSESCNFDWESVTVPGAHPNCIFLVDHYAIEQRFSKVLDMLHKFDN